VDECGKIYGTCTSRGRGFGILVSDLVRTCVVYPEAKNTQQGRQKPHSLAFATMRDGKYYPYATSLLFTPIDYRFDTRKRKFFLIRLRVLS
jgi:hypothetical protein